MESRRLSSSSAAAMLVLGGGASARSNALPALPGCEKPVAVGVGGVGGGERAGDTLGGGGNLMYNQRVVRGSAYAAQPPAQGPSVRARN
jgi:hypothetical protein